MTDPQGNPGLLSKGRQINAIDATNGAAAIGDGARAVHVGPGGTYIEQQTVVIQERLRVEPNRFQVPFPRSDHFVGREDDLAQIHALLNGRERRPVGLCGLGGIGKTQLAVEYAWRHRGDYGDGIFWLSAADPWTWQAGLAEIATRLGLAVPDPDRSDAQMRLAGELAAYLHGHPNALLIFDNVEEPADLNVSRVQGFVFAALGCRTLFTTRRRATDLPFAWLEVGRLPEEASLALLLRHESRRRALDPSHPDHPTARELCRRLGYLPLTLELAAAFLARNLKVTIPAYLARIGKEGVLATVDRTHLRSEDLPTGHEPSIMATLAMQWEALADDAARRALQTAALLPEAEQIPRARLALLTSLPDTAEEGYASPLEDALAALRDLSLVEELTADEVRLHPLVREFVAGQIADRAAFIEATVANLSEALWDVERLEAEVRARGVDAVVADLRAAAALTPSPSPDARERGGEAGVRPLLRALDLDSHILRGWKPETEPAFFLQQWRNRCFEMGWDKPVRQAEALLQARRLPYLRELRRLSNEHPALVRTLAGHTRGVRAVAITPDGQRLASGSDDKTVKIWDLASGRIVLDLAGHTAAVTCLAVSPDGQWVASASRDGTLRIWDLNSGIERQSLDHGDDEVLAVAVNDDGRLLVSLAGVYAQHRRVVRCWNTTTEQLVQQIVDEDTPPAKAKNPPNSQERLGAWLRRISSRQDINTPDEDSADENESDEEADRGILPDYRAGMADGGITFIRNTPYAAFISWDDRLKLVDVDRGFPMLPFEDKGERPFRIHSCRGNNDGSQLITARRFFGSVQLWDRTQLTCTREFQDAKEMPQFDAVFGPDDKWIISGGADGYMSMRSLDGAHPDMRVAAHHKAINSISISPDGQWAVTASDDGTLKVWDVMSLNQRELHDEAGEIKGLAFSPGGRWLITGEADRMSDSSMRLKVWDSRTGVLACAAGWNKASHLDPVVSPDDQMIVSLTNDGCRVLDIASNEIKNQIETDSEGCPIAFFAGRSDRIVMVRVPEDPGSNQLVAWRADLPAPEACLQDANSIALSISPDGRWCVSVTENQQCRFWDLSALRLITEFNWAHGLPYPLLYNIRFSSSSRWVVFILGDGYFKIFDLLGEVPARLVVIPGARFMEVTPDGANGVTVEGQDIEVWNIMTGHSLLRSLRGHTAQIKDLTSSFDGRWIVSVARDGDIKVWQTSNGQLAASLSTGTPLRLCDISRDNRFVVAADETGVLHFLEWTHWD